MSDNTRLNDVDYYLVGYTYGFKGDVTAPKTKNRRFATRQEAKSYAEAVKAHALANTNVHVDLYVNAPLPENVYVGPHGYMPGPTIYKQHICYGEVIY